MGAVQWKQYIIEEYMTRIEEWCLFLGSFTVGNCSLGYFAIFTTARAPRWLRCLNYVCNFMIICSLFACADQSHHSLDKALDNMKMLYREYFTDPIIKNKVDTFQRDFQCCGFNGKKDPEVKKGDSLVESCCPETVGVCELSKAYEDSCSSRTDFITTFSTIIISISVITALLLFMFLVLIVIFHIQI
ncbi:hypothetical protein JTB14_022884 [Gonioctena quinquepunctata]|nr:hypothetical protein JTB14_022884 [Gonioctena quinquepunctata]